MPISQTRTKWAEEQTEQLLAIPFISEFVFRSPQNLSGPRGTQREVADHLILHRGKGLLVSQKTQEDPESRDERRNGFWVLNNAKGAVAQLVGALRFPKTPFWCDHGRLGRVDFPSGLPCIAHGVVIVESFRPVDLQHAAADLPLVYAGTPITYMTINDLLNVAMQLRTVPELITYVDSRRDLPDAAQRCVGEEMVLLEYYLLLESFKSCAGHQDAAETLLRRADDRAALLERMEEYRLYNSLLEHVANALATRSTTYADGLSAELLGLFDAPGSRQNYRLMQEALTDLSLRERAELGMAFEATSRNLDGVAQGYKHFAARFDSKAEWVFVFGASRGIERPEVLRRIEQSMRAALSFYGKKQCLVVVDRDGVSYDTAMTRQDKEFVPSAQDILLGRQMFGDLRITSTSVEGY